MEKPIMDDVIKGYEELIAKIDMEIKKIDEGKVEEKSEEERIANHLEMLKNHLVSKELDEVALRLSYLAEKAFKDENLFAKISELFKGRMHLYESILEEIDKDINEKQLLVSYECHDEVIETFHKDLLKSCKCARKLVLLLQEKEIQSQYDRLQNDIEKSNGQLMNFFQDSLEDYKNKLLEIKENLKLIDEQLQSEE